MTQDIYITGTGRSGSNVLKEIFALHPDVATLPFEHRFTVDPGGIFDYYSSLETWSPYMADHRLNRLSGYLMSLSTIERRAQSLSRMIKAKLPSMNTYPYAGWELSKWIPDYEEHVQACIVGLSKYSYDARYPAAQALSPKQMSLSRKGKKEVAEVLGGFIGKCYGAICAANGKEYFVEDNTWTGLFLPILKDLRPNAKVVHMLRDPRDVVSSIMVQTWTPSDLHQCISYYQELMSTWQSGLENADDLDIIEVKLEDLVADPNGTMSHLCEWIGLDFDTSMLTKDLSRANAGRYKTSFTDKEIDQLNRELAHYINKYGYES